MAQENSDIITASVRAWVTDSQQDGTGNNETSEAPATEDQRWWKLPNDVLVFDTETRITFEQKLTFGTYLWAHAGRVESVGVFYADDLPDVDKALIKEYCKNHNLPHYGRQHFIKKYMVKIGYNLSGLIVGFNLPFDISRVSMAATERIGENKGTFAFWLDQEPEYDKPNYYVPSISVKSIGSKAAFVSWNAPMGHDKKHQAGSFLDLKTLSWALSAKSHTLASAVETYLGKQAAKQETEYGQVTEQHIEYAVNDVEISYKLFKALIREYREHPIRKAPWAIYSSAGMGKAYLQQMNIKPFQQVQPNFPPEILGFAMSTYLGGRTEVHIRHEQRQVAYLDMTSMYPTVFILQNLWSHVIASGFDVNLSLTDHAETTAATQTWLDKITLADFQNPTTWLDLCTLVQLVPDGDILPIRADFGDSDGPDIIAISEVTGKEPLWYTLADVVASKLLSGKTPKIDRAIKITPKAAQQGLKPVKLRNAVNVDPASDNFFKLVIEERKTAKSTGKDALQAFLKVLANSTSYGIFAQFDNAKLAKEEYMQVYSHVQTATDSDNRDMPGQYTNPMLGSFITGAARLMLAVIESVADLHGATHVFMDTDSFALTLKDPSAQNLNEVARQVVNWFNPLNPYAFGGDLLKYEDENFELDAAGKATKTLQPLYAFAVSSKRYCLYNVVNGCRVMRKTSAHGLDFCASDFNRRAEVWEALVKIVLEGRHEMPDYLHQPALRPYSVSQCRLWTTFVKRGLSYADGVKPFGFMTTCARGLYKNLGMLVTTYKHASTWADFESWTWEDPTTGEVVEVQPPEKQLPVKKIKSTGFFKTPDTNTYDTAGLEKLTTLEDVVYSVLWHPEIKFNNADGNRCTAATRGVLHRRKVNIAHTRLITKIKHSNDFTEAVEIATENQNHEIVPAWVDFKDELANFAHSTIARLTGIKYDSINKLLGGRRKTPHPDNLVKLYKTLIELKKGYTQP